MFLLKFATFCFQTTTLPVSDSSSTVSSGGSSTTTTPNTPNSSSTSSSSSTAPSSPSSPATSPSAVGNRHNVKRHSFTAMNTGHHAHSHHRHSAEILSPAVDSGLNSGNNSSANESSSLQVRHLFFMRTQQSLCLEENFDNRYIMLIFTRHQVIVQIKAFVTDEVVAVIQSLLNRHKIYPVTLIMVVIYQLLMQLCIHINHKKQMSLS